MAIHPTYAQLERLIEFMEATPEIVQGQLRCKLGRKESKVKWQELTNIMNNMDGQKSTPRDWSRFWADKKCSLKRRQIQRTARAYRLRARRNEQPPPISNLDDRILMLMEGQKSEPSKKKKETVSCAAAPASGSVILEDMSATDASASSPEEEGGCHAETVQTVDRCMAVKTLNQLTQVVLQGGHIIADPILNPAPEAGRSSQ